MVSQGFVHRGIIYQTFIDGEERWAEFGVPTGHPAFDDEDLLLLVPASVKGMTMTLLTKTAERMWVRVDWPFTRVPTRSHVTQAADSFVRSLAGLSRVRRCFNC